MIYLYVKTHNKTGLKYLGKTISEDPYSYPGSGKYWSAHLEKHGNDVSTEILLETNDSDELIRQGIYYSENPRVVESNIWANLIVEKGDGGDTSQCEAWQVYYSQRDFSGENNPFFGKSHSAKTKEKLAESASKQWTGVPKSKEHKEKIRQANTGKIFTEERKQNISLACKGRVAHNKDKAAPVHYCQHCKRNIAGYSNFTRWHNDNCKENTNAS